MAAHLQLWRASASQVQARRTHRCRHVVHVNCVASVVSKSVSGRMAELKAEKKVAFIPFLVAGDPDLATTEAALLKLDQIGADVIELGVPYSDPLADGPVIHNAATRALERGSTLESVLALVRRTAPQLRAPLVLFTYYNPILKRGIQAFCKSIKDAGASGLLVPDIPLEETGVVREACVEVGLELVLLTTPTTPRTRMAAIARASQGFVYLVSVTGVTGVKESMESRVQSLVADLHDVTDKPVAVGFGVSGPAQALQLKEWGAEGVIVGSALVKVLGDASTPDEGLEAMESLARTIREAI